MWSNVWGNTNDAHLLPSSFKGADVNAQAYNGESVMLEAARSGNPDCIRLLLAKGGDPNLPNVTGYLPIHRAAIEGHYL